MKHRSVYYFDPALEENTWAPEEIKEVAETQIYLNIANEILPLLNIKEEEIRGGIKIRSVEFVLLPWERYVEIRRSLIMAYESAPMIYKIHLAEFLRSLENMA